MKLGSLGYAAIVAATAAAFVIGSVNVGEAKSKKKAAAAAPAPMGLCFSPDAKYCAVKGGMKFTYVNECTAKAEGAKIISNKACPAPKAAKVKKAKKAKAKKAAKKPAKK